LDSSPGQPSTSYSYASGDHHAVASSDGPSVSYHTFGGGHPEEMTAASYSEYNTNHVAAAEVPASSSLFPTLVNFTSSDPVYVPPFPSVDYRPLHWGDSNHHQSFHEAEATHVKTEERLESSGDSAVSSLTSSGRISSSSEVCSL